MNLQGYAVSSATDTNIFCFDLLNEVINYMNIAQQSQQYL